MDFRNRHLVAALSSFCFSVLAFAVPGIAATDAGIVRSASTALGALLILHGMLMGVWGLVHERRRKREIAAFKSCYPQLADIPFDLFKKHRLFIWYCLNTPNTLTGRAPCAEGDTRLSGRKRAELASFDRLLSEDAQMNDEQKRECRTRFITEELLGHTSGGDGRQCVQ